MSNRRILNWIGIVIACWFLQSCEDKPPIPKPPTYLRSDFPKHSYKRTNLDCPYSFDLSEIYTYTPVMQNGERSCHLDINLGQLNGVINFSYIEMEHPLKDYIDYALAKVDEHKVKADAIDDSHIIRPEAHVYGTFFELKGEVASPFQFYLTDSTNHFVSGVVYFNSRPNYDSLRPSLNYLKEDLLRLMNTFEWHK